MVVATDSRKRCATCDEYYDAEYDGCPFCARDRADQQRIAVQIVGATQGGAGDGVRASGEAEPWGLRATALILCGLSVAWALLYPLGYPQESAMGYWLAVLLQPTAWLAILAAVLSDRRAAARGYRHRTMTASVLWLLGASLVVGTVIVVGLRAGSRSPAATPSSGQQRLDAPVTYVPPLATPPTQPTPAKPADRPATVRCKACGGDGWGKCPDCKGTGRADCLACEGVGKPDCLVCDGTGVDPTGDSCAFCDGAGTTKCPNCAGSGRDICFSCQGDGEQICRKRNGEGTVRS